MVGQRLLQILAIAGLHAALGAVKKDVLKDALKMDPRNRDKFGQEREILPSSCVGIPQDSEPL